MKRIAFVAAAAVLVAMVLGDAPAPAASQRGRLVPFSSCQALLRYAKAQAAPVVTAYGFGAPAVVPVPMRPLAPQASASDRQAAVDYSSTNVQEAGVDEPDLVKTDGSTLFAVENGRLESVAVGSGKPRLLDTLALPGGWSRDLLLYRDHVLVISRAGAFMRPLSATARAFVTPAPTQTTLTEVDVSDPAALKVVQTLSIDGSYLAARMIGGSVRVVTSTALPGPLPYIAPASSAAADVAAARVKNAGILASSRARTWLPSYRLGRRASRPLVSCRSVRHPAKFSGLGMLAITTIDLTKGLAPVDSTAVMSDGRIVYASPGDLYVATEDWVGRPLPETPTIAPQNATTRIHAFDISDPDKTRYVGSGTVDGYLLDQWSLSEFDGVLRVVSTDAPAWWSGVGTDAASRLTTLRIDHGALVRVGSVAGIGKGERVYAVRMLGDMGYVVTFKQVDPLTTLDLGDPAHPRVLGELELPGYSSYLHPITNTLLLGIGQGVDPKTNEPEGTQVSLFDVRDPTHPTRVAHLSLGQGWSAAESDHHAFLYWPATGLVVVPFGQQAVALDVTQAGGLDELGRIVQTQVRQAQLPQIDRSLVVGDVLLTVSSAGVAANDLTSLAPRGFTAFPAAPPVPVPGPIPGPVPVPVPGAAPGAAGAP